MFTRTHSIALMAAAALLLATTCPLYAVQTEVVHLDENTTCDTLIIPKDVDEIGDLLIFPAGERLEATTQTVTNTPACIGTNDTAVTDERVSIINLSGRDLTDVWYVANPGTFISNVDGYANEIPNPVAIGKHYAFRIDTIGIHRALVAESGGITPNVWEVGETWDFILQDYFNSNGLPADAINSIGVGDGSVTAGVPPTSSGSIIALPQIPEPGSALLALLALPVMVLKRRQCK